MVAIERLSGSQLSVQNLALAPSPNVIWQAAANMACTSFSVLSGSQCHGRSSKSRLSHDHLQRRAIPKHLRLMIPSPPNSLGMQTLAQGMRQCPPLTCSSPFQMNPLHFLLMILMAHIGSGSTAIKWIGSAISTDRVRERRPAVASIFGFHPLNFPENLSP